MSSTASDIGGPVSGGDPPLPDVARLGLTVGRMLLEWGANARAVHDAIASIARGFGCDSAEAFCQHAAIIVMLRRGQDGCVQMGKVGEHGVNLRRTQRLQETVARVSRGELDCPSAMAEVSRIPLDTPAYPVWFVCLATGLACSAFGRLLSGEWASFFPTLAGAAIGQWLRYTLVHRGHNIFLTGGAVSFVAALLAGIGTKLAGGANLPLAMLSAVLLLVPGVAVLNAQVDVIDGKPNLAASRALRVIYLLLFMALGLAVAQTLVLSALVP